MRTLSDSTPVEPTTGVVAPSIDDFDAFYEQEYQRLLALALALCGSTGAAEDVLQEAFVAALARWDQLADPGAFIRRVVSNRSVSLFRRRAVEARHLLLGRPPAAAADPADDVGSIDLWAEVRSLPKRQQQVVALRYVDSASIDEIARLLDLSPNTVKTHLQRARQSLAARREEHR